MSIDVAAVMDGMGGALAEIAGLRVYDYPADQVAVPAAIVALPESLEYDSTMARGADRGTFQVFVVVGKVSARGSRDVLAPYLSGTGTKSLKAALESDRTLGGAASSIRVTTASVEVITVGAVDYLGALFSVDVIA
jgi:hypothetical protein